MFKVNSQEAENCFGDVLALAESGETVLICRTGKPIAELKRFVHRSRYRLQPDPVLSQIIALEPFDSPLAREDWF